MSESQIPDEASGEPIARLENIDRSFGDLTVLDDVSLTLSKNTVTSLIGPNGSGKTTLVKIAAGVLRPDSGERTIITDLERPVGYLPQSPQFRPSFSVEETLDFYAGLLDADTDVQGAMEQVGLAEVANRRADALSGGMRQLLGVAQGFLGRPALVVLDEPTSGLDPRMKQHIFNVVSEMASDGTAVLLTTHDLASADASDRIGLLNRGQLIVNESPDKFRSQTNTDSLLSAFLTTVGEDPIVQTGHEDGTDD